MNSPESASDVNRPSADAHDSTAPMAGPDRFLNRELSWLDFNARVLALSEDSSQPLFERAKYLAIFSQNLDEFFQVRVSALQEQVDAGLREPSPDGLTPIETLREIRRRVDEMVERQARLFTKEVAPALQDAGVNFSDWNDLSDADRAYLVEVFEEQVFPVLTPLAVDPAHPFPYISNLSLNLAVVVRDPDNGEQRFARVKVPPLLPRFVLMPDDQRFVPLEQVIAAHLDSLFPGMEVLEHHPFRVTRDADFELAEEAEDLLVEIEDVLRRRTKFGHCVRLEVGTDMSEEVLQLLCRELELTMADVYIIDSPLDLSGLWGVYGMPRADLKEKPWVPQTQSSLVGPDGDRADFFKAIRNGDILVHHPYDSFSTSVEAFVGQAARDPRVLAIKQTLYRTSGDDSAIARSLAHAAESGKQVVALVELKARFDELANIERARSLEESGVHVVYGLVGLKTHAKLVLVVRQEDDGLRRYFHIGTGNYNPKTAHLYEDLGLFSCDPDLGADLTDLFNHLTGYSHQGHWRRLLVAPVTLRPGLVERIRGQAELGPSGHITMKMNSLVDPQIIDELYAASGAGTPVELIVRGICCLRPHVPGLSEHITVRSILGRFLEHSRVYRFGLGPDAEYLIGSADLMPRNLDRRVEAITPVTEPKLQSRLDEILAVNLADDTLAWELHADGTYHRVATTVGVDTHKVLQELAQTRAQGPRGSEHRS
ncbi:MAG: polyphosphate kinase 1 [Actinomycetia bacterium]|nr:polyphosphate kinase 1 [Actinomycetes bacterium]